MAPAARARRQDLDATAATIRVCMRCRLHATRTNAVPGEGAANADLVLIGEAPGHDEDLAGRPFVGRAGRILDAALSAAGLPRQSVFITNVVKCRPPRNRKPVRSEAEACRPYLLGQIACIRPRLIVTLGATALRGLMGPGLELRAVRGHILRLGAIPVIPTYHPAAVLYNRKLEGTLRRDLRAAARRLGRRKRPARRRGATGRRT
ncbi:MAG TPA: uracil-DNA glycosylase [Thermoplasmata archaeon]|nr:uracil-DNA glycosylase [Thermoplasmata archaeon]